MKRRDARALLPAPERDDDLPPDYEGSAEPSKTAEPEDDGEVEAEIEPEAAREQDSGLAEKMHRLERENLALKSEVEELRAECGRLRAHVAKLESEIETAGVKEQMKKLRRGRGRPPGSKNKPKAQPIDGGGSSEFLRREPAEAAS
jgi:hypothetical protein